ncbi:hypothetical protein CCB80_10285 [Armatimonadetes bacterium Uphvl-Ar1]|nr:hypothetical protein CCB80_10285 [Armatimonadetes bacterium Uphvl-Ar1]
MTDGFTEIALQLLRDAQFRKRLDVATHIGHVGDEGAGDYATFEIYAPNGVIEDIGYKCNGCPTTMASCEIIGTLLSGRELEAAARVSVPVVKAILGRTTEGKEAIPEFVVRAIERIECKRKDEKDELVRS